MFGGRRAIAQRTGVRLSRLMTFAAVLSLAVTSPAAAGSPTAPTAAPGVHIDPGSPVAKEYAIPLAQARGGGNSSGSGGGQLFGSGITRAPSATAASAPSPAETGSVALTPRTPRPRGDRPRAHESRSRRPVRSAARPRSAPVTPVAARAADPVMGLGRSNGGGGNGTAWMLGVAALVLALGGLGGAVLARHSRRASARAS
jgi:hypothetical protein